MAKWVQKQLFPELEPLFTKNVKQASLDLWRWLADHPGKYKQDWPLWHTIEHAINNCLLCAYQSSRTVRTYQIPREICVCCPLNVGATCADGAFIRWTETEDDGEAEDAALEIVELLEAWDITEEDS